MEKWQAIRVARLKALALEASADIDVLTLLSPASIEQLVARFHEPYGFVQAHREDPALRAERHAAYLAAPGVEHCPVCWVRHGARTLMAVTQVFGKKDTVGCGQCNFSELLPNRD